MENFTKEYFELLTGEYKGINLTRIIDFNEFKVKQIEDSIEPYHQSKVFRNLVNTMDYRVDVGFGGGFPILPLAFINKNINFYGVETRAKKVKVVTEIGRKLGLNNIKLLHSRIENILVPNKSVITFKAVGKVYDFLEKINPSGSETYVFFYKGPGFYDLEKDQISKAEEKWEIIEELEIKLSDSSVDKRYLIGFKYKNVPHRTKNKNYNQLVKLTDLL